MSERAMEEGGTPSRERIVVEFRALPGVDPIRAMRQLLRIALRSCGLKCIHVTVRDKEKP